MVFTITRTGVSTGTETSIRLEFALLTRTGTDQAARFELSIPRREYDTLPPDNDAHR